MSESWGGWLDTPDSVFGSAGAAVQNGFWRSETFVASTGTPAVDPVDEDLLVYAGSDADAFPLGIYTVPEQWAFHSGPGSAGTLWPWVGHAAESLNWTVETNPNSVTVRVGVVLAAVDLAAWRTIVAADSAAAVPEGATDPSPPVGGTPTGDFQYDGYPPNTLPTPASVHYGYQVTDFGPVALIKWTGAETDYTGTVLDGAWDDIASDPPATMNIRALDGPTIDDVLTIPATPLTGVNSHFLTGLPLVASETMDRAQIPASRPAAVDTSGTWRVWANEFGPGAFTVLEESTLIDAGTLPDKVGFAFATDATETGVYPSWRGATVDHQGVFHGSSFQPDLGPSGRFTWPQVRYRYSFPVVTPTVLPPLRVFPRDDQLGGAPRQTSTSVQFSARQGWANTYR